VSTPPNPTGDEPFWAASTTEVPMSTVEAILAVTSPLETVVADQPPVAQEADFTPDTNHACVQLVEQTGEPTDIGANCGHKKPAAPASANTNSAKACGSNRSPGARPVSPKGGQRRPPRTDCKNLSNPSCQILLENVFGCEKADSFFHYLLFFFIVCIMFVIVMSVATYGLTSGHRNSLSRPHFFP
jgi:hypothetical protein